MQQFSPSSMCDVIDITLFKSNYYDNLIFTKCINQVDYTVINDDSILVTPRQLRELLDLNFKRELRKLGCVNAELLHRDANSIYFIDRFLEDFTNLKWIKINLSNSRTFSRLVEANGQKSIKYSFKILKTTLRLNHIFTMDEIESLNPVLLQHGLIEYNKPYNTVTTTDLLNKLEDIINMDQNLDDATVDLLAKLIESIEFKMELDNPEVLLVTDW
jgi:hypothetical protein